MFVFKSRVYQHFAQYLTSLIGHRLTDNYLTRIKIFFKDKHSSLICKSISGKEKKFCKIESLRAATKTEKLYKKVIFTSHSSQATKKVAENF